jgi:hypothetical protein
VHYLNHNFSIVVMPSKSPFSDIEIPNVDLWGLMFDRKEKDFSDDKGTTEFGTLSWEKFDTDSV